MRTTKSTLGFLPATAAGWWGLLSVFFVALFMAGLSLGPVELPLPNPLSLRPPLAAALEPDVPVPEPVADVQPVDTPIAPALEVEAVEASAATNVVPVAVDPITIAEIPTPQAPVHVVAADVIAPVAVEDPVSDPREVAREAKEAEHEERREAKEARNEDKEAEREPTAEVKDADRETKKEDKDSERG